MTGTLFSDARAAIVSTHHSHEYDRTRQNKTHYNPQPTLPGIASILDFAGQHRPQPPSLSTSHTHHSSARLQSSDPVAHALPAFAPIPPFQQDVKQSYPSPTPYYDQASPSSSHPHDHGHRRRSSTITLAHPPPPPPPSSSHSPAPHLRHSVSSLTCPPAPRNPRSSCPESSSSTSPSLSSPSSSNPPARSVRDLCHPSHQPVGKDAYHSTPDRPSSSFPLSSSTGSSLGTSSHHHHTGRHMTDDVLQRRHSERIPGPRSQLTHHSLRPPSPPLQHQQPIDDHRAYTTQPRRESYESLPNSRRQSANLSYEPSPHQQSVSPDIHPLSKLVTGPLSNSSVSSLGPQHRYQCMEPGCGKTFSRPSSLKIHSYSHTGQKPFKCMRCDRAFSVQSNLKRHQKVHEKRTIGGPGGRPVSNHLGAGAMGMVYERGTGRLIEEESGDDDHGSEHGTYDRMEE
ncbi:hypothetical protein PtA15_10A561 [Puccinia triticina]|uniref:C2H2-type domain-containing protein n=1 Tax=Puccinia triticina TaxID=208348 RepID=A0ABY7CXG6_9BASI|nr:uncharacterized protein PtA15_10A561 [Puccinia triticina]WAQ89137.1 hypothetical protein PtA15_10A561 [Puccinia triticina]WAR59193.1 hypothetical protein PtB15_10B535 [Puccinia triticina]